MLKKNLDRNKYLDSEDMIMQGAGSRDRLTEFWDFSGH